jgi:hypothetical protein
MAATRTGLRNRWNRARHNEGLRSTLPFATSHNEPYGSSCEVREVLVKVAFIGATQFLATIAIAFARDDTPPSPVGPWAPPSLPRYEGELHQYHPTETERPYLPAIDPRKTYNLAELIDIAQLSSLDHVLGWALCLCNSNAASDESTPAQSTENVPLNEVSNRSEQRLTPVH